MVVKNRPDVENGYRHCIDSYGVEVLHLLRSFIHELLMAFQKTQNKISISSFDAKD
jgi:hypothetical protein